MGAPALAGRGADPLPRASRGMPFDDAELGLTDPDAVRSAPRPSRCSVFKDRAPDFGREERFYHRPSRGASETRPVDRSDRGSMRNPPPAVKREPS